MKNIINILATLLLAYSVYWFYFALSALLKYFVPSQTLMWSIILLPSALLVVTSVGLLSKKRWSLALYSAALLLFAFILIGYRAVTPLINSYLLLAVNAAVLILLMFYRKKFFDW